MLLQWGLRPRDVFDLTLRQLEAICNYPGKDDEAQKAEGMRELLKREAEGDIRKRW